MRKCLDALYAGAAWLAALCMIGILLMVLLTIVSRTVGFYVPGTDAYAGYCMAGAGFLILASTLRHGEHIRVTLVLSHLRGRARHALESLVLAAATGIAGFLAFYACRLVWQSYDFHDVSVGIDATPLWIPQLLMAAGTILFFIALVDTLIHHVRRGEPATGDAHE